MRWDYWRESKQMHHVDPKTAASNCNSQWETESDPDSDKRRWDGFYSSNHCHALLQQFWFVMPIFRKKIKRSFDFSCHFFWLESFCNFEKQFWRELSNNGASYYYWTSGHVAGGRTDRAHISGGTKIRMIWTELMLHLLTVTFYIRHECSKPVSKRLPRPRLDCKVFSLSLHYIKCLNTCMEY